ncbi:MULTISPECIES: plasmid recombination protein [Pacificibacter]|uniref:plasmid recombination protein n=1 Tax=Pacificibacter TaxID=1042323 RepID=UPI001C096264|nr:MULTISPECIES: plasmid recombination protein [Pacificibacter]MBU2937421.1 plasmid recombination protein [Pacificibacter marinus]MDO6617063.1 plasmid recombination protein [Pacificibacter sp. 1_MG-2023]
MSNKLQIGIIVSTIWNDVMARRPRKPRGTRKPRQPKERQLAGTGAIVTNFRQSSRANLKAATLHQTKRNPDGWSAIDLDRVHLNEVWVGSGMHILNDVNAYMKDVVEPTFKNSSGSPFCTIILGASPEYFRPDGGAPGSEDPKRLSAWKTLTKAWIVATFGDDLVSAIYNGDETTPHVHLAICPTYMKRSRKPDRKKAGETDEAFRQRCEDWKTEIGTKTLSWSSNHVLGKYNSFGQLRESYAEAMKPLGLEYSLASFEPAQYPNPSNKREYVIELEEQNEAEVAQLQEERQKLAEEREALRKEREAFEATKDDLMRETLETGTANALRISKATVAASEKVAGRLEANAAEKAKRLEAERTAEWDERVAQLVQRERTFKRERIQMKEEINWISNALTNIAFAFEAIFDGTFEHVLESDAFPSSKATDDLFERRAGKPDKGDRYEFLSTHFSSGDPIPLPATIKSIIHDTFSRIRRFVSEFIEQLKRHKERKREVEILEKQKRQTQEDLSGALRDLKQTRANHRAAETAEKDAQAAYGKLSSDIIDLTSKMAPLRPAYESLKSWTDELTGLKPMDEDYSAANLWLRNWLNGADIGNGTLHSLTVRLQHADYRAAFAKRVAKRGIPCDVSSDDIRERWAALSRVSRDSLQTLLCEMEVMENKGELPIVWTEAVLEPLASQFAKERANRTTHQMPELAKLFLGLPDEIKKRTEAALDANPKPASTSNGPNMRF